MTAFILALDVYDACVMAPTFYVIIACLIPIISAILFNQWALMKLEAIGFCIIGFILIISALILLNLFRDKDAPVETAMRLSLTQQEKIRVSFN